MSFPSSPNATLDPEANTTAGPPAVMLLSATFVIVSESEPLAISLASTSITTGTSRPVVTVSVLAIGTPMTLLALTKRYESNAASPMSATPIFIVFAAPEVTGATIDSVTVNPSMPVAYAPLLGALFI